MKVAICIPCHGDTKADFTFCLARMIATTLAAGKGVELETLIARDTILPQSRTSLFKWAKEWGADKILWLDSDQTFPPWVLLRLLEHQLDVVGANIRRRTVDAVIPTALKKQPNGDWKLIETNVSKAGSDQLEEVDRMGFGLLLTDVACVTSVQNGTTVPLFEFRSLDDGSYVGEDVLFCDKLRHAGVKIYIDHALSIWVGHIAEHNLMFPRH